MKQLTLYSLKSFKTKELLEILNSHDIKDTTLLFIDGFVLISYDKLILILNELWLIIFSEEIDDNFAKAVRNISNALALKRDVSKLHILIYCIK